MIEVQYEAIKIAFDLDVLASKAAKTVHVFKHVVKHYVIEDLADALCHHLLMFVLPGEDDCFAAAGRQTGGQAMYGVSVSPSVMLVEFEGSQSGRGVESGNLFCKLLSRLRLRVR